MSDFSSSEETVDPSPEETLGGIFNVSVLTEQLRYDPKVLIYTFTKVSAQRGRKLFKARVYENYDDGAKSTDNVYPISGGRTWECVWTHLIDPLSRV